MRLESVNPATGKTIASFEAYTDDEIQHRLARAEAAFIAHRARPVIDRSASMLRAADILDERTQELAAIMTREMGKPIGQSVAEIGKCAWVCRHYAEEASFMLSPRAITSDASKSYVAFQPLGPILAVMPWNFPLWQVFRFAAPALMAGNVALLKHASNVTGCALEIERVFADSGFVDDAFQTLIIPSSGVERILTDPRVKAVTLTGSDAAGRAVASTAGRVLKPSVLELGGSDPFIVLEDADLDAAVSLGVQSRMLNNGQSCIAAKRFIAVRQVAEAFTDRFVAEVKRLRMGDPMDRDVYVGPLAREDLALEIADQVRRAVDAGATILTGGSRNGAFYEPTVLGGVDEQSVAFKEEVFGPVASIVVADDEADAVRLANQTPFGLGGAVFTGDSRRGERVALALDVGCAFVNGMVKSDPRLPFGGVKESGYGRELADFGLQAFVNIKTVWIA